MSPLNPCDLTGQKPCTQSENWGREGSGADKRCKVPTFLFPPVAWLLSILLQGPRGTHVAGQRLRCSRVGPSLADLRQPQGSARWGRGWVGVGRGFLTQQVLGVLRLLQQLQGDVAGGRHAARRVVHVGKLTPRPCNTHTHGLSRVQQIMTKTSNRN